MFYIVNKSVMNQLVAQNNCIIYFNVYILQILLLTDTVSLKRNMYSGGGCYKDIKCCFAVIEHLYHTRAFQFPYLLIDTFGY